MASHRPAIHGYDHLPDGPDPIPAIPVNLPIGVYKHTTLPVTETTSTENVALGLEVVQTNALGAAFFSISPTQGGQIASGFYGVDCWVQFDAAIDWWDGFNPFYDPIVYLLPTSSTDTHAFGYPQYHMINATAPTLWQIWTHVNLNVTVDAPLSMVLTVPLGDSVALPQQISVPPQLVAVRYSDTFTATTSA